MDDAALEAEIRGGLARWWHRARLEGRPAPPAGMAALPTDEMRRLAQLEYIHRARQGTVAKTQIEPPDAHGPGGPPMV